MTMAAGLRATAKAVEHPPEPKVGAPVLDPTTTGINGSTPAGGATIAVIQASSKVIGGREVIPLARSCRLRLAYTRYLSGIANCLTGAADRLGKM